MSQKGFTSLLLVLISALLIMVVVGSSLLLFSKKQNVTNQTTAAQTQKVTLAAEQKTPTPTVSPYKKRLFNPNDKILGYQSYPQEVLDLADNQLVGLQCSKIYG